MPSSNSTFHAEEKIALPIPTDVVALCRRLQEAGYSAYVVGGAVRDLLRRSLGDSDVKAKDFDVATAAPPEEVVRLFGPRRTIPTGIAHGTVTVLCDSGEKDARHRHVEVTTFRGETGYSDGRRPDQVKFIDDLKEDLRRRDFTINAIAYDPHAGVLRDPFDGRGDLSRQLIRAVGDPAQRFAEDGLRLLRAVRFAAQLSFSIDANTRAAFASALPTLRKVSRERVREEMLRLLAAKQPTLGLSHMFEVEAEGILDAKNGLLGVVLPEVATVLDNSREAASRYLTLIDEMPGERRLGALLWPMRESAIAKSPRELSDRLDELLKLPAKDRQHLAALIGFSEVDYRRESPWPDPTLRRFLAKHPPALIADFLSLRSAELRMCKKTAEALALDQLAQRVAAELSRKPPLSMSDLALSGKELIAELGLLPGPAVGVLLRHLLEFVLDDPARNQRADLLAEAARYRASNAELAS